MRIVLGYLKDLTLARGILWCYLIWYLVMAGSYFDASPEIWLTSAGLSLVVGIALILSVTTVRAAQRLNGWQLLRLFLVPFCVSSVSALVKGHGFILIFSPKPLENLLALGLCAGFGSLAVLIRRFA